MVKKRNTETKSEIKRVFTELVREKGFDALTVSDIARNAGINRGTFYLHYVDKYDLMEQLEDEVIADLTAILLKDVERNLDNPIELIPYQAILDALYYVKGDFAFVAALAGSGGDPKFLERFKQILAQMVGDKIKQSDTLKLSMKGLPEDYAKEILLSSITAIIMLWISKGGIDSPEKIAEMVSQAKQISPYELLM